MQVSIIIVSYNAKHHLHFCLESCLKATESIEAEIIVVDNNSTENVVDELSPLFPTVNFYGLAENLGFSKANNLGVEKAKGEFVLILNPDTIIPEDLFAELIPFYQSINNIGMVGVKLIDVNGNFHPESKRNLPTLRNSFSKLFKVGNSSANNYYKIDIETEAVAPSEILVGAFMFLKRDIYLKVGGFDPRYFMYGEDIDISYSCQLSGFTNYYKGNQTVLHFKGESTRKDQKYLNIFFDAMNLFIAKYYSDNYLKFKLMKFGIRIKYYQRSLSFKRAKYFSSSSQPEVTELYWLGKDLNMKDNNRIVLSTDQFSFKEILDIIYHHNHTNKEFYIHSHLSEKIIGSKGLINFK